MGAATLQSYKSLPPPGDEMALEAAVWPRSVGGPISVAIDTGRPSFQFYKEGDHRLNDELN